MQKFHARSVQKFHALCKRRWTHTRTHAHKHQTHVLAQDGAHNGGERVDHKETKKETEEILLQLLLLPRLLWLLLFTTKSIQIIALKCADRNIAWTYRKQGTNKRTKAYKRQNLQFFFLSGSNPAEGKFFFFPEFFNRFWFIWDLTNHTY